MESCGCQHESNVLGDGFIVTGSITSLIVGEANVDFAKFGHNVRRMAVRRDICTYAYSSYFVLWVIVTVVCTEVETSGLNGEIKSAVERPSPFEDYSPISYSRYKRSNEEKGTQSPKEIVDLNSTVDHVNTSFSEFPYINKGITSLKDNFHEKKSPKSSKLNKPYGVDKDNSKTSFDGKYLPPTMSDEAKQSGILKTDKQIKKEDKFNVTNIIEDNLKSNSSNITVPDTSYKTTLNGTNNRTVGSEIVHNMTNTNVKPETGVSMHNDTQPWEMNDQPIEQTDEVTLNNTLPEDDCTDPSIKNCTELGSNSTQQPNGRSMPESNNTNILLISGVCFSSLVLLGSAAGGGYVLYRRRLWNKPQTLSDKCSNADSSGYIDDSTLRENSEEMYSLDNDSFLNSLEAMTIQNYWTDNVKHTKL